MYIIVKEMLVYFNCFLIEWSRTQEVPRLVKFSVLILYLKICFNCKIHWKRKSASFIFLLSTWNLSVTHFCQKKHIFFSFISPIETISLHFFRFSFTGHWFTFLLIHLLFLHYFADIENRILDTFHLDLLFSFMRYFTGSRGIYSLPSLMPPMVW